MRGCAHPREVGVSCGVKLKGRIVLMAFLPNPSPQTGEHDPPSQTSRNRCWPCERIEQLKQLWNEHLLSASQMAARLGITRGAVLGKAHRLNLPPHKSMLARERKPIAPRRPKRLPAVMPVVDELPPAEPAFLGLTLLELKATTCRFAKGDAAPFLFCGQPVQDGSSYCPHHHRMTHLPLSAPRSISSFIPSPWNDYRPQGISP